MSPNSIYGRMRLISKIIKKKDYTYMPSLKFNK